MMYRKVDIEHIGAAKGFKVSQLAYMKHQSIADTGADLSLFERGTVEQAKKGGQLYAEGRIVLEPGTNPKTYRIIGAHSGWVYATIIEKGHEYCGCGDWEKRGKRLRIPCKHMWGVLAYEMGV